MMVIHDNHDDDNDDHSQEPLVISIGYGRTGTSSLKEALDLLGYKTFHTKTMMLERPELLDVWYRNITTATSSTAGGDTLSSGCSSINFSKFLEGYTAATGMLFAVCFPEVYETFPNAYYILTKHKSPQDWYQSWSTLIDNISSIAKYAPWLPRIQKIDYYNRWLISQIHHHQQDTRYDESMKQDPIVAQQSYLDHITKVRQTIPNQYQLLELPVGSGWEPLCQFLNVSLPSSIVEYPHSNTSQTLIWQCRLTLIVSNLILVVGVFGLTKFITVFINISTTTKKKHKTNGGKPSSTEEEEDDVDQKEEEEEEEEYIPNVRILAEDDDAASQQDYLLSMSQMQQLASKALPPMVALRCWKRIYRLSRDGDDFSTFLNATKGYDQTLFVIQTTTGKQVFGAYADSPWDASARENYNINIAKGGGTGYYGSTQACLFTFVEKEEEELDSNTTDDDKSTTSNKSGDTVYKWSGLNRYIQLFDIHTGRVAFGGGNSGGGGGSSSSSFGLCIEDNFSRGTSGPCDTFNNPHSLLLPPTTTTTTTGAGGREEETPTKEEQSSSSSSSFAILDVEIWTFPRGTLG